MGALWRVSIKLDMNLDSQLLNNSGENNDKEQIESLRMAQRDSVSSNNEPQSLREAVLQHKREQKNKKKKELNKASIKGTAIKEGTSKLLQQAWLNLIDSFGLTLIWINIHVLLRYVVGSKFFCKLGEEWSLNKVDTMSNNAGTEIKKPFEIGERMALGFLDFGCLALLLFIIVMISLILGAVENPLRSIFGLLKVIVGNFWKSK